MTLLPGEKSRHNGFSVADKSNTRYGRLNKILDENIKPTKGTIKAEEPS